MTEELKGARKTLENSLKELENSLNEVEALKRKIERLEEENKRFVSIEKKDVHSLATMWCSIPARQLLFRLRVLKTRAKSLAPKTSEAVLSNNSKL